MKSLYEETSLTTVVRRGISNPTNGSTCTVIGNESKRVDGSSAQRAVGCEILSLTIHDGESTGLGVFLKIEERGRHVVHGMQ